MLVRMRSATSEMAKKRTGLLCTKSGRVKHQRLQVKLAMLVGVPRRNSSVDSKSHCCGENNAEALTHVARSDAGQSTSNLQIMGPTVTFSPDFCKDLKWIIQSSCFNTCTCFVDNPMSSSEMSKHEQSSPLSSNNQRVVDLDTDPARLAIKS